MLNIVILAAGMGKRMNSSRPKVLHTIGGTPMLSHVIRTAQSLKADNTVVVIGHGGEQIQAHYQTDQTLNFAWQIPQQGTGDAVKQAEPQLLDGGLTLVLYGDVPLIQASTLAELISRVQAVSQDAMGVLTIELDNPQGYGRIVRQADQTIARIVEDKDADETQKLITEVNTGIMVVPTGHLRTYLAQLNNHNAQHEYYLTDIIAMSVNAGHPVVGVIAQTAWEVSGVNNRKQQAELEGHYQDFLADQLLAQGVQIIDSKRIDIRGELICGQDVFIDVGCVFEGRVTLDEGVHIGPYCVIKNAHIGQHTQVQAFSHIDQSQVGADAKIGPFARLRPGATLADRTHIGNFVEIKNSDIGVGSKANHLAYIGDATVGAGVNIGAGVITVNYDGVNKFRTTIGDGAFIGSDSQLIAPITVEPGATVGAGTTLTKHAPANQLTVGRAKQVTLPNWRRPTKNKVD